MMVLEYLKALSLIFVAEMGDKTQILAMTFAMQYSVVSILTGVGIGAFLNHGIAIALGALLMNVIPMEMMQVLAGALFVFFAFKSLSVEDEDEEECKSKKFGPILTVAIAFFVGELGDKTQLAALGLSTDASYPWIILLGTTSGMMLTSLVGIVVGRKLGKKIPEDKLKIGAFFIFMIFGVQKLYGSLFLDMNMIYFVVLLFVLTLFGIASIGRFRKTYAAFSETLYSKKSQALMDLKEKGMTATEDLCQSCSTCDGTSCMVGYMKAVIDSGKPLEMNHNNLVNKSFDRERAQEMLEDIKLYYEQFEDLQDKDEVIEEVRKVMERIA
jgi:putative Ca2+/H+ antiporter (TMEM165/GDT1 family)